jgi:gluconokinase
MQQNSPRRAIVVMGVAGAGKTTVGERLAVGRGLPLIDGDNLHPPANIAKSSSGVPLTDEDRWPWLDAIASRLAGETAAEVVVTCSALRRVYRDRLRQGAGRPVGCICLHGTPELLAERSGARSGHFAPASLLPSQLAALEDPTGEPGVVRVEIDGTVVEVVARVEAALALLAGSSR